MKKNAMKKVIRDLMQEKRRSLTVLAAIIIGVFAVAMLSSSKSLLNKNLSRNYLQTNPASFTLILDSLNSGLREQLLNLPYIEDVEIRQQLSARLSIDDKSKIAVVLFLIEDFTNLRINTFNPDAGNFPQNNNQFIIERQGLKLCDLQIGQKYKMQLQGNMELETELSGFNHDPGVAPSWMEGHLYVYLPRGALPDEYLKQLNTEVKLTVAANKLDEYHINDVVKKTKELLGQQGIEILRTEVLEPGVHIHQRQMNALMFLVLLFGVLALFLSGFLVINMISAIMAKEIRQIALMKATGASSLQILKIYLFTIGLMSLVAVIIGAPLGIMAGKVFAEFNAGLLNFVLYDTTISHDVIDLIVCTGLILPVFISFIPVFNASRIPIQKSLNNAGVSDSVADNNKLSVKLAYILKIPSSMIFAMRNIFRRKSRLVLTLISLSLGGAIFISSFNIRESANSAVNINFDSQPQDLMLVFDNPAGKQEISSALSGMSRLKRYELGNSARGSMKLQNGLDSKSIDVKSMRVNSDLYKPKLIEGKWFGENEKQVVINHMMKNEYPELKVGDNIELKIKGKTEVYKISGICRRLFAPPGIFMENKDFSSHVGDNDNNVNLILAEMNVKDKVGIDATAAAMETELNKSNIAVITSVSKILYKKLVVEHLAIIMAMLLTMTFLVIIVGGLGMVTSVSINISERKREIGILQAVGISKRSLTKIITAEGLATGVLSWILAILFSLPISSYLGNEFFGLFFESQLVFEFSYLGTAIWLLLVIIIGSIASYLPARRAYSMRTTEALSYE